MSWGPTCTNWKSHCTWPHMHRSLSPCNHIRGNCPTWTKLVPSLHEHMSWWGTACTNWKSHCTDRCNPVAHIHQSWSPCNHIYMTCGPTWTKLAPSFNQHMSWEGTWAIWKSHCTDICKLAPHAPSPIANIHKDSIKYHNIFSKMEMNRYFI